MGWVVNSTPRPIYSGERPSTHCIGGWVGPRADLDRNGKSRSHQHSCSCVHPVCMHVCTYVFMYHVLTYVCVVCMYVYMYVFISTCMHVCVWCVYVYDDIPQNSIRNAKCPEFLQVLIIRRVTLPTKILSFPSGWEKTCTLLGQPWISHWQEIMGEGEEDV